MFTELEKRDLKEKRGGEQKKHGERREVSLSDAMRWTEKTND